MASSAFGIGNSPSIGRAWVNMWRPTAHVRPGIAFSAFWVAAVLVASSVVGAKIEVAAGRAACATTSIGWNLGVVQRGDSYWSYPKIIRDSIDVHEAFHMWEGTISLPGVQRRAAMEARAYQSQLEDCIQKRNDLMRQGRMVDALILLQYEAEFIVPWLRYFKDVAEGRKEAMEGDGLQR